MPEKLPIIFGGIMAFLTAVLGVVGRVTFVRKSQVFAKDGKPLFQYRDSCSEFQKECMDRTCAKITELKIGQGKVSDKLEVISEMLARIDQKMIDHDKAHKYN